MARTFHPVGPEAAVGRRPFVPVVWAPGGRYDYPKGMIWKWRRSMAAPEVVLSGFGFSDPLMTRADGTSLPSDPGMMAETHRPTRHVACALFTDDDILMRLGGEDGLRFVSRAEYLYEWLTRGWWDTPVTIVEPVREVRLPPGPAEIVRWPKSLRGVAAWKHMATRPPLWTTLLLGMADHALGTDAELYDFVLSLDGLWAPGDLVGQFTAPVVGGRVLPHVVLAEPRRGGAAPGPPHGAVVAARAGRFVTRAQRRLIERLGGWLDAWAEALPYAPGLMLSHFMQWLAFALLVQGTRRQDRFLPDLDVLVAELHDVGIPEAAAKGLMELPRDRFEPGRVLFDRAGSFSRQLPEHGKLLVECTGLDEHGCTYVLTLRTPDMRRHLFKGSLSLTFTWHHPAGCLFDLCLQRGIVVR